jgi:hypothetical protein
MLDRLDRYLPFVGSSELPSFIKYNQTPDLFCMSLGRLALRPITFSHRAWEL